MGRSRWPFVRARPCRVPAVLTALILAPTLVLTPVSSARGLSSSAGFTSTFGTPSSTRSTVLLAAARTAGPRTRSTTTKKAAADAAKAGTVAATADAAASRARARVDALLDDYRVASARVDTAVRALTEAFAAGSAAEVDHATAAARQRRAMATRSAQVRAVYAAGGPAGLTGSVLTANSPDEALWRVSTADRVLATIFTDAQDEVSLRTGLATRNRRRAVAAEIATDAQASALHSVERRAEVAARALTRAQTTLNHLDARARLAEAARESARQIAAAQAAADAAHRRAIGTMTALAIPPEYRHDYRAAALTCPGMAWTLLAGVGQVESGHGRNSGPSTAGAIGPMQFMPRTFEHFAVDGDQDGIIDAWDPQDAIFSAAHYLCDSGARAGETPGSPGWKHAALLAYNHAEWYVDLVLAAEQAIIARELANAEK
jgi:transglycosylase-like protein with SLT domain